MNVFVMEVWHPDNRCAVCLVGPSDYVESKSWVYVNDGNSNMGFRLKRSDGSNGAYYDLPIFLEIGWNMLLY